MKFLSAVLLVIVLILIGTIGFAYSGLYDVSATATHSGAVDWLLATTSDASVERRARDIDVPDLEEDSLILAGSNDFNSMCAGCHGAPGKMPDAIGQGLNPPAPDLAEEAANDNHSHMQSEQEPASNVHVHDDGTEHLHEEAAEPETPAEDDHSTHEHQSGDHNEN